MTNDAMDRVIARMKSLWPDWKATVEQAGVWHGYLVQHDEHVVMDAADRYFADSKWKRPVLADLLNWVRKVKNERGTIAKRDADAPLTYAEMTRRAWISEERHREREFLAMSDTEVELKSAQLHLERAGEVYGSGSREVRDRQADVDRLRQELQDEQDGVVADEFTGTWDDWKRERGVTGGNQVFASAMLNPVSEQKRLPPARVAE